MPFPWGANYPVVARAPILEAPAPAPEIPPIVPEEIIEIAVATVLTKRTKEAHRQITSMAERRKNAWAQRAGNQNHSRRNCSIPCRSSVRIGLTIGGEVKLPEQRQRLTKFMRAVPPRQMGALEASNY